MRTGFLLILLLVLNVLAQAAPNNLQQYPQATAAMPGQAPAPKAKPAAPLASVQPGQPGMVRVHPVGKPKRGRPTRYLNDGYAFLLGFFLSFIGMILAYYAFSDRDKRALKFALYGFLASLALIIIGVLVFIFSRLA